MPTSYEMVTETPAKETPPEYPDEACWNCEAMVSYGVVYYTCECGVLWRPLMSEVSWSVAESYTRSRDENLVKHNHNIPMVDHTQPGTSHP
jgi:hypothetical protein